MFRSSAYPSFEADCMNTPDLDNNQTMEMYWKCKDGHETRYSVG